MICNNAIPKRVYRKYDKEFSWGVSHMKWIVYCRDDCKCTFLCSDYLFYEMDKKKVRGDNVRGWNIIEMS